LFSETASVLVLYFQYISTLKTRGEVKKAFHGLNFRLDAGCEFDLYSEIWLASFKTKLVKCKFIPVATVGKLFVMRSFDFHLSFLDSDPVEFKSLDEVYLAKSFDVEIIPSEVEKIFGRFLLDTKLVRFLIIAFVAIQFCLIFRCVRT
jgi:hypothetical protein